MKKSNFTPIKKIILEQNAISITRDGENAYIMAAAFAACVPVDVFNAFYAEPGKIPALLADGKTFHARRVKDYTKRSRYATRPEWSEMRQEVVFTSSMIQRLKEAA